MNGARAALGTVALASAPAAAGGGGGGGGDTGTNLTESIWYPNTEPQPSPSFISVWREFIRRMRNPLTA